MQSRQSVRSEKNPATAKRTASAARGTGRATRGKPAPLDENEARERLAGSSKLYYRIGEVSELTGVKAHVLRYWETEFRWMAPPKSRSKQRLYRKRDIELVWLLKKLLWDQRFTIAGARQRIQDLGLDEALARGGEGEEGAEGARIANGFDGARAREDSDHGATDWLGIQVALESMQNELLTLRGVLQQGL